MLLLSSRNFFFFLLACLLGMPGCTSGPVTWWKSLNKKASHLSSLENRYESLQREHEALKQKYYRLEFELAELKGEVANRELAKQNLAATGSILGRHPASISYKVPEGLKPEELESLAYEHFREKRFAEAAICFEEFLVQPESATLHDANDMYSAGVAWFQIGNFKKAKEHLESSRLNAAGEQKEKIRKKVDLWMRVIDRQLASEKGSE